MDTLSAYTLLSEVYQSVYTARLSVHSHVFGVR